MSLTDSITGSAYFLPTLGAAIAAGLLVVARRHPHISGLPRGLAIAVFATTALLFSHVVPAALGILSRPAALGTALLLLLAAWRLPAAAPPEAAPRAAPPPSSRGSIAIAVLSVSAALVYELVRLRGVAALPPDFVDAVGFHLPGVVSWIHAGSLWRLDQFYPGFATAQYPNNGDFLTLAAVMPWHDLALVRFAMVPFYVLGALAAYALGIELGGRRAACATFAAMGATVPYISSFAFDGIPDVLTISMLAIGLLFLCRYVRAGVRSELLVGGLAVGLAFGAKWYGVTDAAVIVVVFVAWRLIARRHPGAVVRETVALGGMILAGGGIWLVRNLVESSNPIYPKAVSVLGITVFSGSHHDLIDRYGYTIAHYLGSPHVLGKYIIPSFASAFGLAGLALIAGLVAVIARGWPEWRRRSRELRAAPVPGFTAAVAVGVFLVYLITPGTAYGPANQPLGGPATLRWLMPAAVVGAAIAALGCRRLGRAGVLLELAGLAGVLDGIRRGERVSLLAAIAVCVLVAIVAGGVLVLRRGSPLARIHSLRPPAITGAAIATGIFLVAAIFGAQRSFHRYAYASHDPVFAWIYDHAPSGHRVAMSGIADQAGLGTVLPMAGPRLGNVVAYVGDRKAASLELPASASSFDAELRRGSYDLLEVGRYDAGHTDLWVRALGWGLVASSKRVALYAAPPLYRLAQSRGWVTSSIG